MAGEISCIEWSGKIRGVGFTGEGSTEHELFLHTGNWFK